jgi:hypothetical protein
MSGFSPERQKNEFSTIINIPETQPTINIYKIITAMVSNPLSTLVSSLYEKLINKSLLWNIYDEKRELNIWVKNQTLQEHKIFVEITTIISKMDVAPEYIYKTHLEIKQLLNTITLNHSENSKEYKF